MPISEDELAVVEKVVLCSSFILISFSCWIRFVGLPKCGNHSSPSLFFPCIGTVGWMAAGSYALLLPILMMKNEDKGQSITVTSSINFCEDEYQHTKYMAEPANTVSNWCSYLPVAAYLLLKDKTSWADRVCYIAVLMIGVGSTMLHAFLSAVSQGGDELPMLWYTASTSYLCFSIIFPKFRKTVAPLAALSAIAATAVYVFNRANFLVFYMMFNLYTLTLITGLIYIACAVQFESNKFKAQILYPFCQAIIWTTFVAIWTWVSEMKYCAWAHDKPYLYPIWNYGMHPFWHFWTGLLAILVIQVFAATRGYLDGRGIPVIAWMGAPVAHFDDETKHT